jgi:hypothetical protein
MESFLFFFLWDMKTLHDSDHYLKQKDLDILACDLISLFFIFW